MTRFTDALYTPLISNWDTPPHRLDNGGTDTTAHSTEVWKHLLADHHDPGIDPATLASLHAFLTHRTATGGALMN